MKRLLIVLCALVLAAVFGVIIARADGNVAAIRAEPSVIGATLGETVEVVYYIDTPDNVQAADLHLSFNPNRLRFLSAVAGADLPVLIVCYYNNMAGTIDYGGMRYVTPATGHIEYVKFTFLARDTGWEKTTIRCRDAIVAAPGGIALPWAYENATIVAK